MEDATTIAIDMTSERNNNVTKTIKEYSRRLFSFIKQRVAIYEDAEDILQDVFYQFAGNTEPIGSMSSWLFTVARNKIIDKYRKQKLPLAEDLFQPMNGDEDIDWKEVFLQADDNTESAYIRNLFWEELQQALDELPPAQREVFIQNEIEDIPFKVISANTGVNIATLITRKRYAVLHLRERLQILRDELLNY
ncbi:MAG: RNA polymerase sigma factor [Ginsengibacter sp.]